MNERAKKALDHAIVSACLLGRNYGNRPGALIQAMNLSDREALKGLQSCDVDIGLSWLEKDMAVFAVRDREQSQYDVDRKKFEDDVLKIDVRSSRKKWGL